MPDPEVPPQGYPFTYPIPGRPPPDTYIPPDIAAPADEPEPPDVRFPATEPITEEDFRYPEPPDEADFESIENPIAPNEGPFGPPEVPIYGPGPPVIFTPGPPFGPSQEIYDERRRTRSEASPLPPWLERQLRPRGSKLSPQSRERSRPPAEREIVGRRRGAAPTFGALPRPLGLPQPSYSASEVFSTFRQRPPRTRPAEELERMGPVLRPEEVPWWLRRIGRRKPGRNLDEILRDMQRIPFPSPDEMAPYPVLPPRTPPSRVETPVELPPEPLRVPMPERLPDAPYPQTAPLPPALPPATLPPARRAPPGMPRRVKPTRPRPAVHPVRIGQTIGISALGAAILRPILRRRDQGTLPNFRMLQSQLVTPDVVSPGEVRDRFGEVLEPGISPERVGAIDRLTDLNTRALGFASTVPQTARARDEECVCEKTEEEEEEDRERNRSNVVAQVKTYRRRMSQNSLDNLKKG